MLQRHARFYALLHKTSRLFPLVHRCFSTVSLLVSLVL